MFVIKKRWRSDEQACLPKFKVLGNGGQALMTVVLIMTITLTVGLSLASRSIVDLRTSSEEADSQKALAAADAGIERALASSVPSFSSSFPIEIGSEYAVEITDAKGQGPFLLNSGNLIPQGEGIDIWLINHNSDGSLDTANLWNGNNNLDIYWGTSSTPCDNAALEISVIEGTIAAPKLVRYTVDPCASRRTENKFSADFTSGSTIEGVTLQHKWFKASIAPGSTALVVRVVPIYSNAIMGVSSNANLPIQGFLISSTGTSQSSSSREVKRTINLFRAYEQLSTLYLNYGLFSP